jgi:hypothetical protein
MSMQQRLRDEKWHKNTIENENANIIDYRNKWYKYIIPYDDGDMYEDFICYDYDIILDGEVY